MNCTSVIYKTWGNTRSNSMFVKLNEIMFKIKIRHVLLLIQMKRHQSQSFNRIGILICGHVVLQFLQNSAVDMENCQTRDQACDTQTIATKTFVTVPRRLWTDIYDSIVTILHFIVHNFLYIASQLFFWFNFSHRLVDFKDQWISLGAIHNELVYVFYDQFQGTVHKTKYLMFKCNTCISFVDF